MKIFQQKQEGFTLIELIIVIGIIALLSSMSMAYLNDSKKKAVNTGTIAQVKEYETAVGIYTLSNGNRYPNVEDTDMHCMGSGNKECLWAGVEIETENSGPLVDLGEYISGLPFVDTPTLSGVGTYKGLLYQCNDIQCKTANFYWPEVNTDSCTKGTVHYTGTNGVLCKGSVEGTRE